MSNEYLSLLKRPEWQKKRLEKLELAGWECENCGCKDNQLHVHHRQYFKNRMPWQYNNEQLEVLCNECHEKTHISISCLKDLLSYSNPDEIFAILFGYVDDQIVVQLQEFPEHFYSIDFQAIGVIAKILTFVNSQHYYEIANILIQQYSFDKDAASDFFKSKYNNDWDDL